MKKKWKIFNGDSCPRCGDNVEVLSDSPECEDTEFAYNGSYMKRSHSRTFQLSSKLSGYVLYTVLCNGFY